MDFIGIWVLLAVPKLPFSKTLVGLNCDTGPVVCGIAAIGLAKMDSHEVSQ